jgi:hypothetical protein
MTETQREHWSLAQPGDTVRFRNPAWARLKHGEAKMVSRDGDHLVLEAGPGRGRRRFKMHHSSGALFLLRVRALGSGPALGQL